MILPYNLLLMADRSAIIQRTFLSISLLILFCGLTLTTLTTTTTNTVFGQSQNPSVLTNTPHPKIASNATTQKTIVSNTTHVPITSSGTVNSSSLLSNTPHPKVLSSSSKWFHYAYTKYEWFAAKVAKIALLLLRDRLSIY